MIKEYAKQIKDTLDELLLLCDNVDERGFGTSNYIPDSSTREITILALKLFCLYLASADDDIKEIEVEVIGEIFGKKESAKSLKELAEKSGATKDEFGDQIPLILNCVVDVDNAIDNAHCRDQLTVLKYMTPLIYEIYSIIGAFIIVCDEELSVAEYDRLMRFMDTMYHKIKTDLNKDLNEILPPVTKVSQALSNLNVTNDQIALIRRRSTKNNKLMSSKTNLGKTEKSSSKKRRKRKKMIRR